jgi:hypothetical protein
MFVVLIFMFNVIFSHHVFGNLGLIAIENQTLYSVNTVHMVMLSQI